MSDIGFAIIFIVIAAMFFPEHVGKSAATIRDAYAPRACEAKP